MSITPRISHGQECRRATLAGHTFVEAAYPPGTVLQPHAHAHPYLVFVLRGTFDERSNGGTGWYGPGMAMIRPAGTEHSDRFGAEGARVMIMGVGDRDQDDKLFADVLHCRGGPAVSVVARLYGEMQEADSASEYIVDGLLRELAGLVQRYAPFGERTESRPPKWLVRVWERLRDDCLAPPLMRDLALEVGIHPDHLSRSFRRHYGVLPGDFVRSMRLTWAAHALLGETVTIAAVAARAGYADQSHFTRAFKKQFGVTPAQYRGARAG